MHKVRWWMAGPASVVLAAALLAGVPAAGTQSPLSDGVVHWQDEDAHHAPVAEFNADGPDGTVYRLYRAYFLRDPDASGFSYWLGVYRAGYPLDAISGDFARSAEFVATYGALSNRQFLDRVYRNVMERQPDQSGYDYWLREMSAGMSRGQVMIAFSDSKEFRAKTATTVPPVPDTLEPDDPNAFTILRYDQNNEPIRWNPCRPVRVAANLTGAPDGTEPILRAAVQRLAAATEVEWTYVGRTTERAADHHGSNLNRAVLPDVEVVVSWPPVWDSPAGGTGGAAWARDGSTGETWFVVGSVQINPNMRFSETQMLHLLMHELGHVAGLGHPEQSYQVMSQGGRLQLRDFRAGDRSGLAIVGRSTTRC